MTPLFRAAALAALAALLAAGCARKEPAAAQARGGDRRVPVTIQRVASTPFNDSLQALGTVKARESITVTAKVSEIVQAVHFDSGDVVAAGAPLVTLSGQQQQASLTEALAASDEAERLLRRQNELAAQQLIARATLDTQRAARDAARARVAQIRAQLGDRTIRAPFAGVLGIRQVSPGALVTPGTAIATLDDVARVYVDFPVPETQLAVLAPGQSLHGRAAAYPGRAFDGVVSTIDARVDPATRAVTVRGEFPNIDRALRPGMLVQIDLQQAERQALRIPEIALVQGGSDSFVFRVGADDKVERADVQAGTRANGLVEIRSGLKAGDRIVVDGTGKLKPGDRVADAGAAPRGGRRG